MIMKNFKFLYLLLAVEGVVTFTSCTEEWTPGAKDTNAGVYFADTSVINVTAETTSADIVVKRTNANDALTVSIRSEVAEDATNFLTVPSSVSFEAGSDTAVLTVTVNDAANMVEGKKYNASIQLDSEQASAYGVNVYTFSFMIPEKWVDYTDENGKVVYGTYIDDFFCPVMEYPAGYASPARIQKHETDVNRYRVLEPFGRDFFTYMFGDVPGYFQLTPGAYIEFNIADPNNVTVVNNPVNLGASINFSDIGLAPMYLWVASDDNGQVPGAVTYNEGVFQFAAGMVSILYESEGKLYELTSTNASGLMAYILPGVEITDYALSVEYTGMYVAADNSSASAVLEFGAGADVESIKYAVVEGDVTQDYASVVEGIVDGSIEPIYEIKDEAELTQEIALTRGSWTVVAVPYGAEEAVVEDAIAYSFWFNGVGEVPQVEVEVRFGSMLELTGEENAEFSSDYWAGVGIVANGDDIKSIKVFVNTLASVENSGMSYEAIVAGYGEDFSSDIDELKANGSAIVGPFNVPLETEVIALVSIETIYGETKFFSKTCTTTNSTGIQFGTYEVKEGDYETYVGLFGGYKAGEVYFVIDGMFEMVGSYDTATRTMTTIGVEETYTGGSDIIRNDIVFYTDSSTKTHAYGYWAAADADYSEACDLTFAYAEDGAVNALACYFAKFVYDVTGEQPVYDSVMYEFTPAATVTKYVAEATSSKAAFACAKNSTSNAKLANVTVKSGDRIWIPAK
jgi:hypothetical protein